MTNLMSTYCLLSEGEVSCDPRHEGKQPSDLGVLRLRVEPVSLKVRGAWGKTGGEKFDL